MNNKLFLVEYFDDEQFVRAESSWKALEKFFSYYYEEKGSTEGASSLQYSDLSTDEDQITVIRKKNFID